MVLLQDGPGLDGGEGPPHYEFHRAAVQPAEGARADAGDKRILNCCRWGLPFQSVQHLLGGDEDAKRWGAGRRRAGVLFHD